jgi:phosphoglycolate phosphatase-like HAD superfamily hydrolase
MLDRAATELGFSLRNSVVIGDHLDDYYLGKGIGAKTLLVRTGHGRATEEELKRAGLDTTGVVFPTLLAAVQSLG